MVEIGIRGPLATAIALLIPLVIFGCIAGVTIFLVRRTSPSGSESAVSELQDRFARGEIDEAEFQARMDTLKGRA